MTREFTEVEEEKLMIVLEFFLSLHEADTIFNMIFGVNDKQDIIEQLRRFKWEDTDPDYSD
jgi:uncharacterized membrane protein